MKHESNKKMKTLQEMLLDYMYEAGFDHRKVAQAAAEKGIKIGSSTVDRVKKGGSYHSSTRHKLLKLFNWKGDENEVDAEFIKSLVKQISELQSDLRHERVLNDKLNAKLQERRSDPMQETEESHSKAKGTNGALNGK